MARSYWDSVGAIYADLGSPLAPSPGDIHSYEHAVREHAPSTRAGALRALLLGVTPAIASMNWPDGTWLTSLDSSLPMVREVWPGDDANRRAAACASWLTPPLRDASVDVIAGDLSINCLRFPDGLRALASAAARLLDADGILITRLFVQADRAEPEAALYDSVLRGEIGNFHTFKLRLLAALQPAPAEGVPVRLAYESWTRQSLDPESLPDTPGWSERAVRTIQLYREASTRYFFPDLAGLRAVMSEFLEEISITTPGHESGERFPLVVYRPWRQGRRP